MNILQILLDDHQRLRREINALNRSVRQKNFRARVKDFISLYELHEAIEEEILLPEIKHFFRGNQGGESALAVEEAHPKVWAILERLVDSIETDNSQIIESELVKFASAAEGHFTHEEKSLFPAVQKSVDREILEDLGVKARGFCARYSAVSR